MKGAYRNERAKAAVLASYDEILKTHWPVRIREKDLEGPWGRTHVIEAGNPDLPHLILFHGVGDNSAVMWPENIAALSARFHCCAVDSLGGPGRSEPNSRFFEDFDYLDWIRSTVVGLGLERYSVAGVSNGGVLAYETLARGVAGAEKAVCIEGGPIIGSQMGAMFRTLCVLLPEILIPTKRNMIRAMGKLASPHSRLVERFPWIAEHVVLCMRGHNQAAMRSYRYRRYDPEADRHLRGKMLFILGDWRQPRNGLVGRLLEPGGYRYAIVKDAGHAVNQEQAAEVDRLMIDFLGERG